MAIPTRPKTGGSQFTVLLVIPAGKSQQVPVTGNKFYLTSCNGSLSIQPNNGFAVDYTAGQGLQQDNDQAFSILQVINNTSAAITATLVIGWDTFIDNRLILVNGPLQVAIPVANALTTAIGKNITTLANATPLVVAGNSSGSNPRKALVATNLDAGVSVTVKDSNGNVFATIFPQQPWYVESSDSFTFIQSSGGAINFNVGEIYYNQPITGGF